MSPCLYLRIGRNSLSVARQEADGELLFSPYPVASISMPANLREAFRSEKLLASPPPNVKVLLDSDVLTVPIETFDASEAETLYNHTLGGHEGDCLCSNVLPDLKSVALFAMSKDLRTVLTDHFPDAKIIVAIAPVWRHLHARSFTGTRGKLYGWLHEGRLEVSCFQQNRFKFCNSFEVQSAHDALYFLLYVWKQLMMEAGRDEIHIVGHTDERDWLMEQLKKFVGRAYLINPSADFNRAPATQIVGMPYDLMTLICKGR